MNSPKSPDYSPESRGILDRLDTIVNHLDSLTSEVQGLRTQLSTSATSTPSTEAATPVKEDHAVSSRFEAERAPREDVEASQGELTSVKKVDESPALTTVTTHSGWFDSPVVGADKGEETKTLSAKRPSDAESNPYSIGKSSWEQGGTALPRYGEKKDASSSPVRALVSPAEPGSQTPWWKDDKKLVRVIASFGVIITLLGVGFLVAVAITAGLFPPVAQVTTATVLGLGLGVAAWKAQERKVSPPAVIALALTAMGTLILSGYGFTHYVMLVSAIITYPLMTVVAAIPHYFARRWDLPWLSVASLLLSFVMLLSAMTSEPNLAPWPVVAVVAIVVASTSTQRDWLTVIKAAAGLGTFGLFATYSPSLLDIPSSGPEGIFHWFVLAFAALIPAAMLVVLHRVTAQWAQRDDMQAEPDDEEESSHGKGILETLEFLSLAPLLFTVFTIFSTSSMLISTTVGVAALIAIALSPQRLISAAAAVVIAAMALWHLNNSSEFTYLLAVAAFMVVAIATFYLPRTNYHQSELSAWTWLCAALVLSLPFTQTIIGISLRFTESAITIVVGLAIMAFVAHIYMGKHEALSQIRNNVTAGVIALYLVITGFMLVFISFGDLGFRLGHALVSLALIALGAYLLVVRSHDVPAGAGALLVVVAIGKLIFFDMASIDGIIRTFAFIASGMLLLGIAVARGKYKENDTPVTASSPTAGKADPPEVKKKEDSAGERVSTSEKARPDTGQKPFDVPDNPYRND